MPTVTGSPRRCVWDDGGEDQHFPIAARLLVSGVIAAAGPSRQAENDKTSQAVARIISTGNILGFCRAVAGQTKDPDIVQKLGRFAADEAKNSKEVTDVIATAITQLGFISGAVASISHPVPSSAGTICERSAAQPFISAFR